MQFDKQKTNNSTGLGSCISYTADIGPIADTKYYYYKYSLFTYNHNLRFQMFFVTKIITCLPLKTNLCILGGTSNGSSSFFRSSSIFVSLLKLSTCALLLPSIVLTWIHMMAPIKFTQTKKFMYYIQLLLTDVGAWTNDWANTMVMTKRIYYVSGCICSMDEILFSLLIIRLSDNAIQEQSMA